MNTTPHDITSTDAVKAVKPLPTSLEDDPFSALTYADRLRLSGEGKPCLEATPCDCEALKMEIEHWYRRSERLESAIRRACENLPPGTELYCLIRALKDRDVPDNKKGQP